MKIKTQDLNERFLLAFYINNILIINDMRLKGFKAKFMMAFWGLFVEAHYIAADNDTMEGSQGILPFIILLIVSIGVIAFLSYYMYRLKKENIAKDGELMARNDELLRSVDALSVKNREIQQMLVNKIRETDNWNRDNEVEREDLKKRLEEMEKLHNSFFAETIHEMRTPLSLVLGSLSELLQRKNDIDSSEATQLLSAYRNTLALQDLIEQLRNTRHGDDVANHLRIARYDMISITKQICDLFVDWIAMNNVEFHINTQTSVLWVWIDRRKMEFALRVLLSNALKNTYRFGKISINISVVRSNGKAYCSFSIKDDGLGESESTRLGLKQIVDMTESSGAIFEGISSEDETGTQYTILIPLGRSHYMERAVEFIEPDGDLVKLNEMQKEEIAELIQVVPKKKETGKKMLVIDDSDQSLTMTDVRLEEAIVQTKAKMVVLDPIQGFLGADVDMHRANEIRPLMKRIAVLSEKYHCAVILIGHMNKNSNGKSSYRGLGSIDFQAAARSVLIVGRVKDEPEVRVVCHTKSSLAPEGTSIAFRLDKNNGFEWIGEYDISADELLNGDGRGQKSRKAKEFLLEILANGGMTQKKIAEEAEARGIKSKTLWNAKRELEIDSVKRGKQWYWMLPE